MVKNQGPMISSELNQEESKYSALMKINEMLKIITLSRKQNELKIISQLLGDIIGFVFNNCLINIVKIIMDDNNTYCVNFLQILTLWQHFLFLFLNIVRMHQNCVLHFCHKCCSKWNLQPCEFLSKHTRKPNLV